MTLSRSICHLAVAAFALGFSVAALAQEDAPPPAAAPPAGQEPSVDEVIESLPADQQKAVEEAIEEAESPGGTKVIVVPPPEPEVRKYDPSEETDQEAEAEEYVRRDVPGDELHPKGEDEMMGDHVVDRGDIKFRPGKGVEINSADDDFQLRIRLQKPLEIPLCGLVLTFLKVRRADEKQRVAVILLALKHALPHPDRAVVFAHHAERLPCA